MGINWTDEIIERLTEHRKDGYSAEESRTKLTEEFGVEFTRNMVIAKRHRLGLTSSAEEMRHKIRHSALKRHAAIRARTGAPEPTRVRKPSTFTVTSPKTGLFVLGTELPKAPMPVEESTSDYAKLLKLDELEASSCRFPIGDPKLPDFGFCGDTRVHGQPYCARHCQRAFKQPEPRIRRPEVERVPTMEEFEKV